VEKNLKGRLVCAQQVRKKHSNFTLKFLNWKGKNEGEAYKSRNFGPDPVERWEKEPLGSHKGGLSTDGLEEERPRGLAGFA